MRLIDATRSSRSPNITRRESYLYINVPKEIRDVQTSFQRDLEELRKRVLDLTIKLTDANALATKLIIEKDDLKEKLEKTLEK